MADKRWHCGSHQFDCSAPLIMGIVNTTPDSFSDGGNCFLPEDAFKQGMRLLEQGADILDLGGESTRPGATPVSADEESRRVLPAAEKLARYGAVVSVDTMKPEVMRRALDAGAAIINDVNGFQAAGAMEVIGGSNCGVVVMHKQGEPQTMQNNPEYGDVVAEVRDRLRAAVEALWRHGVAAARIAVDPGIGFGKTQAHNLALLEDLSALTALGQPLLLGVSRKSLFTDIVPGAAAKRDAVSATAAVLLAARGANILRVHNVAMTVQALRTANLLKTLEYG